MLTVWLVAGRLLLAVTPDPSAPPTPVSEPGLGLDVAALLAPILSTGVVGTVLLMILFKVKLMPSWVYDDALKAWTSERTRLEADNAELKAALKDANRVYTEQVIPTLTRVLDAERELVDLRREEAVERRRGRADS